MALAQKPLFPFARRTILTLFLAALSGCSPAVTPALVKPPPQDPAILVVGEIAADEPEARRLARLLRKALMDRLLRAQAFAVVYDRDARQAHDSALILAGEIIEADRGSDAWRFAIGAGVGRPRLAGMFRISDAQGAVLAAFTAASDEAGPSGLAGHWSSISLDEMATGSDIPPPTPSFAGAAATGSQRSHGLNFEQLASASA